jgi:hypothetical protein
MDKAGGKKKDLLLFLFSKTTCARDYYAASKARCSTRGARPALQRIDLGSRYNEDRHEVPAWERVSWECHIDRSRRAPVQGVRIQPGLARTYSLADKHTPTTMAFRR